MLATSRVKFDVAKNAWMIYGYDECRTLFSSACVAIPPVFVPQGATLNSAASTIANRLARISNDHSHQAAREAALSLYQRLTAADIRSIVHRQLSTIIVHEQLLPAKVTLPFDWVNLIAKRSCTAVILNAFGFEANDTDWILANMPVLVKLLSPVKTADDIEALNRISIDLAQMVRKWLLNSGLSEGAQEIISPDARNENADLLVANLVGLLIQSYDAGRGLLTNLLFALSGPQIPQAGHAGEIISFVEEVLRIDGPVHNTTRIAVCDIEVTNHTIRNGDRIVLTLAAANLDPLVFDDPISFNAHRANNKHQLSFGYGAHECIARPLMIKIATEVCDWLLDRYRLIEIVQPTLEFEPQQNVRLIRNLLVRFHKY